MQTFKSPLLLISQFMKSIDLPHTFVKDRLHTKLFYFFYDEAFNIIIIGGLHRKYFVNSYHWEDAETAVNDMYSFHMEIFTLLNCGCYSNCIVSTN